jgi:hypothetical protein
MVSPPLRLAVGADGSADQRALGKMIHTPTAAALLSVAGLFQATRAVTASRTESPVPPGLTQSETDVAVTRGNVVTSEPSLPVTVALALVLKSANGSAFRAERFNALL